MIKCLASYDRTKFFSRQWTTFKSSASKATKGDILLITSTYKNTLKYLCFVYLDILDFIVNHCDMIFINIK